MALIAFIGAWLKRLYHSLLIAGPRKLRRESQLIRTSPLFDREWYLAVNEDVSASKLDPARHYLEWGWREGRDPGPNFSTAAYLKENGDVARAGINPLVHFILFGESEGRGAPEHSAFRIRRHPLGPSLSAAAPCFSPGVADEPPIRWRRAFQLNEIGHTPFVAAGLAIALVRDDDKDRERLERAFEELKIVSGFGDGPVSEPTASADLHRISDAWFVNAALLRMRWRSDTLPFAVRAFQHDPAWGELCMIGEGLIASPLDFVDAHLLNPFFPILMIIVEPQGQFVAAQLLPFPSFCRGGLHYAEYVAVARRHSEAAVSVVDLGERCANRLSEILHSGRPPLIDTIEVDLRRADGTGPLFQREFQLWLELVLRIGAKAAMESDKPATAEYLESAIAVRPLAQRAIAGGALRLASDMVPTISALTAIADTGRRAGERFVLPLIVAQKDHAQPATLFSPPTEGWPHVGVSAGRRPGTWPELHMNGSNRGCSDFPIAAVRIGVGTPLHESERLIPVAGVDSRLSGRRPQLTWLVFPEGWQAEQLVEALEALSLQSGSFEDRIAVIGAAEAGLMTLIKSLFPQRVDQYQDIQSAVGSLGTPLVGYIGPGVVLHDVRLSSVASAMLVDDHVASVCSVLVAAEPRGRGWHISVEDAGAMVGPAGKCRDGAERKDDAEQLWGAVFPVFVPASDLWVTRTSTLGNWLSSAGAIEAIDGVHLCTAQVTASYIAGRQTEGPPLSVPPAAIHNATHAETLFG